MPHQRSRLHVLCVMTLHCLNAVRFIRHCIKGAFALNIKATIVLIAACAAFPWAIAQNDNKNLPAEAIETSDLGTLQRTEALARARIAQERKSALDSFAVDEVACYQKFQVNSCLVDARSRRSAALSNLNRQEVALNDAQRQREGAEKLERLADKKAAQNPQSVQTPQTADPAVQAPADSATTGQSQPSARLKGKPSQAEAPSSAPTSSAYPLQVQPAAQAAKSQQTEAKTKAAAASKAATKAARQAAKLAGAAESKARFEARVKEAQVRSAQALLRQQKAKKDVAPLPLPLPLPAPLAGPSSAPQ